MTTLVLADDHGLVRHSLKAFLETQNDMTVLAEAADGTEAIDLVDSLKPDVLVTDLMMVTMNGLEVTRRVRESSPQTSVVILTMHDDSSYVNEAMRLGARGYVLKDSNSDELVLAIRTAAAGKCYLCAAISPQREEGDNKTGCTPGDPFTCLTGREKEIMGLLVQGCTNTEISSELCISPRTVESHRSSLMHKLHIHNQTELFHFALRRGILASAKTGNSHVNGFLTEKSRHQA